MDKYQIRDRNSLLEQWKNMFKIDNCYLHENNLENLLKEQKKFIQKL